MSKLNRIVGSLRHTLLTALLATVLLLSAISPVFAAPANPADRGSDVTRASDTTYKGKQVIQQDRDPVDKATIKKIQSEAEDLGDGAERSIGDTGLKNIRKLGENIPETLDLKAKQTRDIYSPQEANDRNPLEVAKDKVEDFVKDLRD